MRRLFYSLVVVSLILSFTTIAFCKDYSSEEGDSSLKYHFKFDGDEIDDMAKGPYKAKDYADWMLEIIENEALDKGAIFSSPVNRAVFDFKLTGLARDAKREGEEILQIEIRAKDSGDGQWTLELYDEANESYVTLTE